MAAPNLAETTSGSASDRMLAKEKAVLSMVGALGQQYNLDKANVTIFGFSRGGGVACWIALRNPSAFRAVAAASCSFGPEILAAEYPDKARDVKVIIYYGEKDEGDVVKQSRAAIRAFQSLGVAVETAVVPDVGHEMRPEPAMRFFQRNQEGR